MPAVHISPLPQGMAHPPQLAGSDVVSTHAPPQSCVPPTQVTPQLPLEHACPPGQIVPQVPQLLESICVLTQAIPQSVVPPAH
jgi:hypothetical protein